MKHIVAISTFGSEALKCRAPRAGPAAGCHGARGTARQAAGRPWHGCCETPGMIELGVQREKIDQ